MQVKIIQIKNLAAVEKKDFLHFTVDITFYTLH